MAVALDVTDRATALAALRDSEERFRTAFEDAPIGMALVALDGRFMRVNSALTELTGHSAERLVTTTLQQISHPEGASELEGDLRRLAAGEVDGVAGEARYLQPGGEVVSASLNIALVRDRVGGPQRLVLQAQDITDRKRYEDELQFMADHDPLTGLVTRRGFDESSAHLAAHAYRPEGAVLALDLDHFKYVNDTLGHNAGDELIASVTGILRRRLRRSDTLARLGGDEFAVLLPARGPRAGARRRPVARGRAAGRRHQGRPQGLPAHTTTSIGVTLFDEPELTGEEMVIRADLAMYNTQGDGPRPLRVLRGRGREEHEPRMRARLAWVDRIRAALRDDRLILHAQPIVFAQRRRPADAGAAVADGGRNQEIGILPTTFLYVAERLNLIQEIDRWVTGRRDPPARRRPCRRRHGRGGQPSGQSLGDDELLAYVERDLRDTAVPPAPTRLRDHRDGGDRQHRAGQRFAERLRSSGCDFALDDFGVGLRVLLLPQAPAVRLPEDRWRVRHGAGQHRTDQIVVQSLVSIAKGLGKPTIAEFRRTRTPSCCAAWRRLPQSFHTGAPHPIDIPAL